MYLRINIKYVYVYVRIIIGGYVVYDLIWSMFTCYTVRKIIFNDMYDMLFE